LNDILDDGIRRSDALVQSIIDMLYVYNLDLGPHTQLIMRVGYLFLDLYGKLEEWFKFQTTFISATLLKQDELPVPPSWLEGTRLGVIGGGKLFREIRNLMGKRTITRHVMSFAASILALKRGALPLRAELVEESLMKHRDTLSQMPKHNDYIGPICAAMREMDEVMSVDFKKQPDWRIPSASSAFGWRRADGGALGSIISLVQKEFGAFSGDSKELAGYSSGFCPIPFYVPSYMFEVYDRVVQTALRETLDCDVHVVLEPMKARIITSGPPCRYHVCRILQKVIHSAMRTRKEFALIGGPATESILNENFRMLSSRQSNHWVVVSADYSAATDNINGLLCEAYVDGKVDALGLVGDVKEIYSKSMTNHILHYPEEFGGFVETQRTGQLMGSPSSFPGLCHINVATLFAAWKHYLSTLCWQSEMMVSERSCPRYKDFLNDLRPMANGDDLLFICPPDFVNVWRKWTNAAGLKPSPGKNYVSRDFAVINSTFFQLDRSDDCAYLKRDFTWRSGRKILFSRVHWVGSGLLKGQARVLSDTRSKDAVKDQVDFGQLNSQLAWVLDWEVGMEDARKRCLDVWFRNMRSVLMAQDRSWRLPVLLGGLGLPIGGATRPQLVLANMIIKCQKWELSNSLTVRPKVENPVARIQLAVELGLRKQLGLKRVPIGDLPWSIHRVSDDDVRVVEARPVDLKVPDSLIGLPSWEQDDSPLRTVDFLRKLDYLTKHFNGGPMSIEKALAWDQPLTWIGHVVSIPHPELLRVRGFAERCRDETLKELQSWGTEGIM
jgi:hypothetical protein